MLEYEKFNFQFCSFSMNEVILKFVVNHMHNNISERQTRKSYVVFILVSDF